MLWHPPAVIIEYQDMTLSYPSHTPSTRFPTGTVLALLAAFRFKDYHPYLSQYFSSCGSHYPETPGTFFYYTIPNLSFKERLFSCSFFVELFDTTPSGKVLNAIVYRSILFFGLIVFM